MGFYIRKSIRVGGMRLNLSKSGLGVSTGVRGFRVGMNGRGTYVHMGRGGLYYRKQFAWQHRARGQAGPRAQKTPPPTAGEVFAEDMARPIALSTTTAGHSDILNYFKPRAPWRALAVFLAAATLWSAYASPRWAAFWAAAFIAASLGYLLQNRRGILVYDLDGTALADFQTFVESFEAFFRSQHLWLYEAQSHTTDWKRNAGATRLLRRRAARALPSGDPAIRTNLSIPCLSSGKDYIYFLPDLVVVRDGTRLAAYAYRDLSFQFDTEVFIEDSTPPADAQVVGHAWRYTRKDGGPDLRFNNNRQYAKCLYQTVDLRLTSYARSFSKSSVSDATGLNRALRALATVTPGR